MAGEGLGTGLSAWRDFHYVGHAELRKGKEDDVGNEGEGQEVEDDERGGWDACVVVSSCKQRDGRALPGHDPDLGQRDRGAQEDDQEGEAPSRDGS
jgi:hypothetical protein